MDYRTFKLILILFISIILTAFSHIRNTKRNVNFDDIEFFESPMKFISLDSVNKLLKQIKQDTSTHLKRDLNLYERILSNNEIIEKADLSIDIENRMFVSIKERNPVLRFINQDSYLDDSGKLMPLSNKFTERIPIIIGTINEQHLQKLGIIGNFIKNDSFLKNHISGLEMDERFLVFYVKNKSFKLKMDFFNDVKKKFFNYKVFYKSVNDSILNTYSMINLNFKNQIIAKK
tara:strand:- start:5135 stop:5830 length:696 start_codon:yes stop_codon:yes gene_type:complete